MASPTQEAAIFTRYLIGKSVTEAASNIYNTAMQATRKPDEQDARLLAFVLSHHWALGPIDGGLVFLKPLSEVRRRLYVMTSILETQPEYADCFLPKRRGPAYVLVVAGSGIRAVLRAISGIILIKVIAR